MLDNIHFSFVQHQWIKIIHSEESSNTYDPSMLLLFLMAQWMCEMEYVVAEHCRQGCHDKYSQQRRPVCREGCWMMHSVPIVVNVQPPLAGSLEMWRCAESGLFLEGSPISPISYCTLGLLFNCATVSRCCLFSGCNESIWVFWQMNTIMGLWLIILFTRITLYSIILFPHSKYCGVV